MADARHWLAHAKALLDADHAGLATSAARTAPGFAAGAEWMRGALGALRGRQPDGAARFAALGMRKYAIACSVALLVALAALACAPWLLPLAIVAFYAVEVRMVFAFPFALDGSATPLRDSHRLVAATAPSGCAVVEVMRIAAEMLFGGLGGRGVRRSWCAGCLAVLLWYEHARQRAAA